MTIRPVSYLQQARDADGFARELGASFERYGFAVLSDHPIPAAVIDPALADARALFALPEEVKRLHRPANGAGQRGHTPFGVEIAKGATHHDLKEFWHVGRELTGGGALPPNVWPAEPPGFRPHLLALYAALDALGARVLAAVARHLGLADTWFEPAVREGDSLLRLLHYPPVADEGPHVRAGAHEDIDVITLLLGAEEAGLEILDRNGRWLAVNPPPGSVVVNVGDMLQRLTAGRLPSTTHRVVNPAPERRGVARYSTPFFLHFAPDFLIEVPPELADAGRPAPPPITAGDFLRERLVEIGLA